MRNVPRPAPEWQVQTWFNTSSPLSLQSLRGKVVVLEAFQMLCPGCVSHGIPQAQRIAATFASEQVAVVGLHSVFEHHAAMAPVSLQAFLHEYRITFPVGVDMPGEGRPIPRTMEAYGMRGTPSLLLIDADGLIRHHHLGQVDDLLVGAQIAGLLAEASARAASDDVPAEAATFACENGACVLPEH